LLLDVGSIQQVVTVDPSGCVELPALPPGNHQLRASGSPSAAVLVDQFHRSAEAAETTISVLERPVAVHWPLSVAGWMTVQADAGGARPPDAVSSGEWGWMIRGDQQRLQLPIGAARAVHPGNITVVISACRNPEAFGSSVAVAVEAEGLVEVAVPLAQVVMNGLSGKQDAVLLATRMDGCADGTGTRPTLRWNGGLSEGMRVALPHGRWEVRLETATGTLLAGSFLALAGEPGASVAFP
jgi:hypothetical protein